MKYCNISSFFFIESEPAYTIERGGGWGCELSLQEYVTMEYDVTVVTRGYRCSYKLNGISIHYNVSCGSYAQIFYIRIVFSMVHFRGLRIVNIAAINASFTL